MTVRSVPIDVVRIVAMLAIIAGHVSVNGPLRPFLYSWHVPVFFVLSGYLWKERRSFGQVVVRRAKSLLVPYVAWLVILGTVALTIESSRGGVEPSRPLNLLWGGQFATGRPFWAIWFVPALFFATLIYRLLARLPILLQWLVALALCIVSVYVPGDFARYLPLGMGLALPGVLFMVAGVTLQRIRSLITHPVGVGLLLLVVSFGSMAFGLSGPVDLKELDLGTPALSAVVAIMTSVGLIMLAEGLLPRFSARLAPMVTPLARASLAVLFLHVLTLTALRSAGLPLPVVFLLTVCVVWAVGVLLLRTPFGWILTGVPPNRQQDPPLRAVT